MHHESYGDLLREYQLTIHKWFLLCLSAALIPFWVNNLVQGRYLLAAVMVGLLALFLSSVASIHFRKKLLVPNIVAVGPVLVMLWLAVTKMGVVGLFWYYPTLLIMYFFLSRMESNVIALGLTGMAVVLAHLHVSDEIAIRVGVTMLLTSVFANIFLHTLFRLTSRLNDLATVDALTGLHNRRYLDDCARQAIERKKRYGVPTAMLLIDADHFKQVNDQHGHATGDEVLKRLAAQIRSSVRTIDQVYRIGGEEFVVMLPEADATKARFVAEKLCRIMRERPIMDELRVTLSIGVAELDEDEALPALLRRCDKALYEAKARGRDRACMAVPGAIMAAAA